MKCSLILWSLILVCFFAAPVAAIPFDHAEHQELVELEVTCVNCHKEDAKAIVPSKEVCLECHEEEFYAEITFPSGTKTHGPTWALNHRAVAKSGVIDCSICHEQEFCLDCHKAGSVNEMGEFGNNLTNVHRSEFHVTHPIAARTDPQLCDSCHERDFCVECHDRFAPEDLAIQSHRKGWSMLTVSEASHAVFADRLGINPGVCNPCHPNSVLPAHEWSNAHAREARKNLATCQACHPEGDVCLTCHSAKSGLGINPHPRDWDNMKDRLRNASDNRTCRKCH
jgi:hypothetical protein